MTVNRYAARMLLLFTRRAPQRRGGQHERTPRGRNGRLTGTRSYGWYGDVWI